MASVDGGKCENAEKCELISVSNTFFFKSKYFVYIYSISMAVYKGFKNTMTPDNIKSL